MLFFWSITEDYNKKNCDLKICDYAENYFQKYTHTEKYWLDSKVWQLAPFIHQTEKKKGISVSSHRLQTSFPSLFVFTTKGVISSPIRGEVLFYGFFSGGAALEYWKVPQTMISSPQSLSQSKPFGVLIHSRHTNTTHTHTHIRRGRGRKKGLVHLLTGSRPPSWVCLVLPLTISSSIRGEVLFYGHVEMFTHTCSRPTNSVIWFYIFKKRNH